MFPGESEFVTFRFISSILLIYYYDIKLLRVLLNLKVFKFKTTTTTSIKIIITMNTIRLLFLMLIAYITLTK